MRRPSACSSRFRRDLRRIPRSFVVQEGVELVDDDGTGALEESRDLESPQYEHGLQGFRGDEQDPLWVGPGTGLNALGDIPVPWVYGQLGVLAEVLCPSQLVIDEGFEWSDVDQVKAARSRRVQNRGYQRKKCGLGLAAGGGSSNDEVPVTPQKDGYGPLLDVVQLSPALVPDPALDRFREQVECS